MIFLKGFAVGFSVALPIGPVALLCIRQTLSYGKAAGLATALGAALADGVYTLIAALGALFVQQWIHDNSQWIDLCGGIFLIGLGIKLFRTPIQENAEKIKNKSLSMLCVGTFALCMLSPMTTFLFISLFGAYNVFDNPLDVYGIAILIAGVVTGTMVWFFILTTLISKMREKRPRISLEKLKPVYAVVKLLCPKSEHKTFDLFLLMNHVSSIGIMIYGVITFLQFIKKI